jgi:CysZ protein
VRDFFTGVRLFGRGVSIMLRSPRLLLIGAVPAVLTTVLLFGGMLALVYWIDELAALITPFAEGWALGWRTAVRGAAGVALFAVALVLGLISFTALTLAIGGPFYEHIAEKVEDGLGDAPAEARLSWWRLLWWGLRDGVALILRSLMFTVPLLICGFIPVVGQTVVPVLLTLVTAWFLALELVAVPCYRRGMNLKQRRQLLSTRRTLALGLGTPATLLCAIPFAAILVMPVAVAGGVLVAHETFSTPA